MAQVGWTIAGKPYTFQEAIDASRQGLLDVPVPLLKALSDNRDDTTPSASVLGGCIRRFQLQRDYDYYDSLEGSMARGMGTAVHAWLAPYADEGTATEKRLRVTFTFPDLEPPYNEVELYGTPDNVDEEGITFVYDMTQIRDWKTKIYVKRVDFYPPKEHRTQVNIYHYLHVMNGGKPLDSWELVYMDNKSVPRTFRGPLRDVEKVGKWLHTTLHDWAATEAEGGIMPPVPAFYKQDKKGNPSESPCKYCPVYTVCKQLVDEQRDIDNYVAEEHD